MYAIVLDGEVKSALAATRSLGKAGRRVVVGSVRGSGLAGWSRFAHSRFTYPDPKRDQDKFIAHLLKAIAALPEPPVILAFSDATYLTLFSYREELSRVAKLVFPSVNAVDQAFDKAKTYALAKQLDIPTIPEYEPQAVTDFPVIVKPHTSVSFVTGEGKYGTATVAFDAIGYQILRERILAATEAEPIVQTLILGPEYGVECLAYEGVIQQLFVHRRVRSQSPRGGAATVKTAVIDDPAMVAMVQQSKLLIGALQWSGPIMVEWKVDERDHVPRLMEINGRFWGSLPLPERAGVGFAVGFDLLARGFAAPPARQIRALTTQHFLGDLRWLWRVLVARDPLRVTLYPSRWRALMDFIRTTVTVPGDVFSYTDPGPFVAEYFDMIKKHL